MISYVTIINIYVITISCTHKKIDKMIITIVIILLIIMVIMLISIIIIVGTNIIILSILQIPLQKIYPLHDNNTTIQPWFVASSIKIILDDVHVHILFMIIQKLRLT